MDYFSVEDITRLILSDVDVEVIGELMRTPPHRLTKIVRSILSPNDHMWYLRINSVLADGIDRVSLMPPYHRLVRWRDLWLGLVAPEITYSPTDTEKANRARKSNAIIQRRTRIKFLITMGGGRDMLPPAVKVILRWIEPDGKEGIVDLLEQAAEYGCFAIVNAIVDSISNDGPDGLYGQLKYRVFGRMWDESILSHAYSMNLPFLSEEVNALVGRLAELSAGVEEEEPDPGSDPYYRRTGILWAINDGDYDRMVSYKAALERLPGLEEPDWADVLDMIKSSRRPPSDYRGANIFISLASTKTLLADDDTDDELARALVTKCWTKGDADALMSFVSAHSSLPGNQADWAKVASPFYSLRTCYAVFTAALRGDALDYEEDVSHEDGSIAHIVEVATDARDTTIISLMLAAYMRGAGHIRMDSGVPQVLFATLLEYIDQRQYLVPHGLELVVMAAVHDPGVTSWILGQIMPIILTTRSNNYATRNLVTDIASSATNYRGPSGERISRETIEVLAKALHPFWDTELGAMGASSLTGIIANNELGDTWDSANILEGIIGTKQVYDDSGSLLYGYILASSQRKVIASILAIRSQTHTWNWKEVLPFLWEPRAYQMLQLHLNSISSDREDKSSVV